MLQAAGETMAEGDVICDIQTDKAVMSMEATEDGTLAKILTLENVTCKVGELIALVAEDGEEWQGVAAAGLTASPPAPEVGWRHEDCCNVFHLSGDRRGSCRCGG